MQAHEPPRELPEIETPSAEFFIRLFVIPALIVLGIVGLWLAMSARKSKSVDAMAFVRGIREDRAGWRAAFELANRLNADPATASDPRLLGELIRLLDAELERDGERKLAEYLALAVGSFQVDRGLLDDGREADPAATLTRGLDPRHDPTTRLASAASLARVASRNEGTPPSPETAAALAAASREAELPELRRMAVFALGFLGGDESSEILRERLRDDSDRYVRDNAALALIRRGDPAAADALRVMLAPDDGSSDLTETVRLQALAALARPAAAPLLVDARPSIEALASLPDGPSRDEARRLLQKLQSSSEL